MYRRLVANYIQKMNYADIKNYVLKNYPKVTEKEIQVIYRYIKNSWEEIYDEEEKVLEDLKKEVSASTYLEIMKLLKTAFEFKNR